MRPARAVIDLHAIEHNLQFAKRLSGNAKVAAAVKANGYGHGSVAIMKALQNADWLAVASLEEALQLRQADSNQPILLLEGVFEAQEYAVCAELNIEVVIHHSSQIDMLHAVTLNRHLSIWLKHDSGMGRLGLNEAQINFAYNELANLPNIKHPIHLMTHFASADEPDRQSTQDQWARFASVLPGMDLPRSAANSAAIQFHPQTHGNIVRAGLMLYGAGPDLDRHGVSLRLRPAMQLETSIIALRSISAGSAVGYGASWVATRDSLIATAAIGYGDGYPRVCSNKASVVINGQRAPLAGRVSMDMIGIDVTDIDHVSIGDVVILWGDGMPIEEVAEHAGTIPYELMCGVTARVPRIYKGFENL